MPDWTSGDEEGRIAEWLGYGSKRLAGKSRPLVSASWPEHDSEELYDVVAEEMCESCGELVAVELLRRNSDVNLCEICRED